MECKVKYFISLEVFFPLDFVSLQKAQDFQLCFLCVCFFFSLIWIEATFQNTNVF